MGEQNEEKVIWEGSPSQMENLGSFILMGLLSVFIIPLFAIVWYYLVTKNTKYKLTNQRFKFSSGVLNKDYDYIELYRVRDYNKNEPLLLRMFGLCNITLISSDKTYPTFTIHAVPSDDDLINIIRNAVEASRKENKVREVDFE